MDDHKIDRRTFLKSVGAASATMLFSGALPMLARRLTGASSSPMVTRSIPATGEPLPVVGLGTWQQFDVESDPALLKPLVEVLEKLFSEGGSLIDTSPMYGRAETVLGELLSDTGWQNQAFLATKVWTRGRRQAVDQLQASRNKMNREVLDLVQVHNLVDWETHLPLLREWKQAGRIRYCGITHYTRSAFDELRYIMENEALDFVQLPYSIDFRQAEDELIPLARQQEIAVIVNRPFGAGRLFRSVQNKSLPDFVEELGIESWAQYFLKYIIGHPDVTCVIPGTSNPHHMLENARAGQGPVPTAEQRNRMLQAWRDRVDE